MLSQEEEVEPLGHDPVGGANGMTSRIEWVTTNGTLLYDNPPDADVLAIISARAASQHLQLHGAMHLNLRLVS